MVGEGITGRGSRRRPRARGAAAGLLPRPSASLGSRAAGSSRKVAILLPGPEFPAARTGGGWRKWRAPPTRGCGFSAGPRPPARGWGGGCVAGCGRGGLWAWGRCRAGLGPSAPGIFGISVIPGWGFPRVRSEPEKKMRRTAETRKDTFAHFVADGEVASCDGVRVDRSRMFFF